MTNPRPSYRSLWLPDLLGLTVLLFLSTVPFLDGSLDLRLQSLFHRSSRPAWPFESWPPWRFLYHFGTWPALITAIGGLLVFTIAHSRPSLARWRHHGLFLFLVLAIGPGLFVNTVFKDHWGRPRPRQVAEFGGKWEFQPFAEQGVAGRGKSFPCGHSSAGYYFVACYFLLRRRHLRLAILSLAGTVAFGTLIGIARMAAGAHFASDVAWSAFFPALAAFLLYYSILRIPAAEDDPTPPRPVRHPVIIGVAAFLLATGGLAAWLAGTPVFKEWHEAIPFPRGRSPILELTVDRCDVELSLSDSAGATLTINGQAQGFGWPWSKLRSNLQISTNEPVILRFMVITEGPFNELAGTIRIHAPARLFREIRADMRDNTLAFAAPDNSRTPPLSIRLTRSSLTLPPSRQANLIPLSETNGVRELLLPAAPTP